MKRSFLSLLLCLYLPVLCGAAVVPDSGLVRFRLGVDDVTVSIDGGPRIIQDSYGNPIGIDTWSSVSLTAGVHTLRLSKSGYLKHQQYVVVKKDEVTELDVRLQPATAQAVAPSLPPDSAFPELGRIVVLSDPNAATISIAGFTEDFSTPSEFAISIGDYTFDVLEDGFEPLSHEMPATPGESVTLTFVLKPLEPPRMSAEELGLERQQTRPIRDSSLAGASRRKFDSMAEIFVIIPFGQGVLARALVDENQHGEANALIFAGVGLTVGSYLIGRIVERVKRRQISRQNAVIADQNRSANAANREIDAVVRQQNADAIAAFRAQNRHRGRVVVEHDENP